MLSNKARWGSFFCSAAAVLLGVLYVLFHAMPAVRNPVLYQKGLPALGLVFSCLVLFFGNFSYPRLHSIKVYFIGYTAGCAGIVYFTLCKSFFRIAPFPPQPHGFYDVVILIALINLVVVTVISSDTKYRTIRSVMLCVIAVETALFCILRFGPGAALWLKPLLYHRFWIEPVLLAAVVLLSIGKIRSEFFLGGIVAGCAVLLFAAGTSRFVDPAHADQLHLLIFTGTTVYLFVSLVIHGFLRMEHRIAYDPLLKIYNRDYCSKIITEQANVNVRPPFGVAMVDIDHFKQVNDTYGHQAGDAVLHTVSQAVQRGAGRGGIACRYGGEELAIFFPQKTVGDVCAITEEMRKDIEKTKTTFGRKTIEVTISVGVSCREHYSQSIVDVIQAADKALYTAKEEGRNRMRSLKTPIQTR